MLNSKEIRNVKFSKSVGGYKQEEVDILLDKIEADYEQFDRIVRELNGRVEQLTREVDNYKNSQSSIQNVLVSAQKLADQIVDEAKVKSEQIVQNAEASIEVITVREKELSTAFDRKASERKAEVEKELDAVIAKAQLKKEGIEKATEDSVKRQQLLFDKLKLEISAFKAEITQKYKEHLEILQKLPDEVPMDPSRMAEAVAAAVEKVPMPEAFVEMPSVDEETAEDLSTDNEEKDEKTASAGFVINGVTDTEEAEEE